MSFEDRLKTLAADVGQFFQNLPEEVHAALPTDTADNLEKLVSDGAADVTTLANNEIAAADAKLPTQVRPFAPLLAGLLDKEIGNVSAAAQDRIQQLTDAKAIFSAAAPA